jgi:hypothetical protein
LGPWLDLGTEEAAAAMFPAAAVAGGEGLGVEEHKEVERDLRWHSGGVGVVGGGSATKLCSRRRWRSGGRERRGRGREASVHRGEAICGVNWSRGRSGIGAPQRARGGSGHGMRWRYWRAGRSSAWL